MRVVIIGGSGHVGTYLVPRLVEAGFEVVNVTRGKRDPYQPHAAWKQVQTITADRDAEDAAGTFGARIRDLQPEIVIDMICFSLPSAVQLAEALRGRVSHFLHCGTIWAHGASTVVPATESLPRAPFGEYDARALGQATAQGFPYHFGWNVDARDALGYPSCKDAPQDATCMTAEKQTRWVLRQRLVEIRFEIFQLLQQS